MKKKTNIDINANSSIQNIQIKKVSNFLIEQLMEMNITYIHIYHCEVQVSKSIYMNFQKEKFFHTNVLNVHMNHYIEEKAKGHTCT